MSDAIDTLTIVGLACGLIVLTLAVYVQARTVKRLRRDVDALRQEARKGVNWARDLETRAAAGRL